MGEQQAERVFPEVRVPYDKRRVFDGEFERAFAGHPEEVADSSADEAWAALSGPPSEVALPELLTVLDEPQYRRLLRAVFREYLARSYARMARRMRGESEAELDALAGEARPDGCSVLHVGAACVWQHDCARGHSSEVPPVAIEVNRENVGTVLELLRKMMVLP
jgi:hypothetical protein